MNQAFKFLSFLIYTMCFNPKTSLRLSGKPYCSVPDQGILGRVPPGDRDLMGRQLSGNLLP